MIINHKDQSCMIVNYIEPIFEHQFIYHSYACRKGKGAHRASKQLTRWLYNLEVVQGKSVYVLKADIHHYFQSMVQNRLAELAQKGQNSIEQEKDKN